MAYGILYLLRPRSHDPQHHHPIATADALLLKISSSKATHTLITADALLLDLDRSLPHDLATADAIALQPIPQIDFAIATADALFLAITPDNLVLYEGEPVLYQGQYVTHT